VPLLASSASSAEVFDQDKNLFSIYTENATLSEPIAEAVRFSKQGLMEEIARLQPPDSQYKSSGDLAVR
jgi:hypothetical protein